MAYWAEADSDQQKYIRKAFACSSEPICVPPIDTLIVHEEPFTENVVDYDPDENQFDLIDNSTSDEDDPDDHDSDSSESCCTDLDIDYESHVHVSDIEPS